MNPKTSPSCPLPISDYPTVQLAHGGGGILMHQLLEKMIVPTFRNAALEARHDGAALDLEGTRVAFSTDSYVVHPIFFPGGDIGELAVNGTVNDLAMCGAEPKYLSAGMIIEEGFPMEDLWRVVLSMQRAAEVAGVQVVTGDTKVVDRGKGDGLYINTAGIGIIPEGVDIAPARVRPGDAILLSGDLGRHGTAIMACREGLAFDSEIESDCAPLNYLVKALLEAGLDLHGLRDLTRGGLASTLVEVSEAAALHLHIDGRKLPVRPDVRGACEILGLDPAYVANEGRMAVFLPEDQAEQALLILRNLEHGEGACLIGRAEKPDARGLVTITSEIGAERILDMLSGEQLPRIC